MTDWSFPRAEALPTYPFLAVDVMKREIVGTGADLIDLGLGNPDRETPAPIVAELQVAATKGENHRYHPGKGARELRESFARWYERRYRARFDPESETIVTIGAKEGISHLCLTVLDRGDTAIIPNPCYPIHGGAPIIAGADVEPYEVSASVPAAAAVQAAIDRVRARGGRPKMVIANYPHNPTGIVASKEALGDLVRVVQSSGALFLHDIAYADLDFTTRHAPSIFDCGIPAEDVKKFAVEAFSMSKSYNMPGWRIGLLAGNERMISALTHVKSYLDYGTFRPLQLAAAWALDHGDSLVDEIRARYEERLQALASALTECGWLRTADGGNEAIRVPGGTMFLWVPVPTAWAGVSSMEVVRRLIERAHVAVAPGSGFGTGGEGFVRFSLIVEPGVLREACRRIGGALGG